MQVKSGTIFDNFLITDDEKYAEEFGEETWGQTKDAEKKMKDEQDEEERKKAEEAAKAMEEEEEEEGEGEEDEDFDTEEVSGWVGCSFNFFQSNLLIY
jgi:calreticulin